MSAIDIAKTARTDEPGGKLKGLAKRPALAFTALTLLEERRKVHTCKAPAGVTAEDLLYEEFWRHVSVKLNRHDIVFVIADDESWEVECRVETSKPDGAELSITKKMKRQPFAQRQTILGDGEFMTIYQNGSWDVLRVKDRYPVIRGYASESTAIAAWLREQPRKV